MLRQGEHDPRGAASAIAGFCRARLRSARKFGSAHPRGVRARGASPRARTRLPREDALHALRIGADRFARHHEETF